jgi:GT2 family glycosyltransferase
MLPCDLPPDPAPVDVSVVIVNWNRLPLLQAALDSLKSGQGAGFEVIVVDNGSTDGSAAWLAGWQAPFPLRVIRNQVNAGFCQANNQGISAARGEFVALLNNDAEAGPGWLGELRAAFLLGADVGMAASKILVWEDPRIIDKIGHLMYPDGQNRGRATGELDAGQYDTVEEVAWPDGAAAMYRKAMLDETGGFDEDLFAYADDAELGLRARIAGWRCFYMPRAVVRHHRGATLGQTSVRRVRLIERNRVLLAAKLFPGSLLWKNPFYYLARLTAGARASALGLGEAGRYQTLAQRLKLAWALLSGDLQALAMLPRMMRKRAQVSKISKLTPGQVEELLRRYRISLRELSHQAAHREP